MVVFLEVQFQTVAVLGGVGAVGAPVLVHIGVRLHVRVQHRLIHTSIITCKKQKHNPT